jgi:superfamily II DNA helicase RecQ
MLHLRSFIFDFFNAKGGDIRETSMVLVLTPLNVLIEDQMACLRCNGIEADVLNTNDVKQTNPDNQDDGVDNEAG